MFKYREVKIFLIFDFIILASTILLFNFFSLSREVLLVISFIFLSFNILFLSFIYYMNKEINIICNCINNMLNEDYLIDIRNYKEGLFGTLKSDTFKVVAKFKEISEYNIKEKEYLKETLSDISHQIKTPITSMYIINDILLEKEKDKSKKEFLMKNRTQLERIEWLVVTLLKMSRLESGSDKLVIKEYSIQELVEKALEPLGISMELKEQNIIINITGVKLLIDLEWTVESLSNIIKNAYEHTPKGGTIEIASLDTPIYTELSIKDNGCGISKKDLPHIFERFYKGSSNKDSIGIGLYMAKKVLGMENASVSAESSENGTCFSIKFYKNNL